VTRHRLIATARVATAAVLIAILAGCGIVAEKQPREVQPPPGPYGALASSRPSTAEPGSVQELLYFTKDGVLVPVTRKVRGEPTPTDLVRDLFAGPTESERAQGIGSALSGTELASDIRIVNGLATVNLVATPEGTGRSDEILAYAQIVCTLDARPAVTSVTFTRQGAPIGVPRATAELSDGPFTTADYASLITTER
jgi:spore germination protein GerM